MVKLLIGGSGTGKTKKLVQLGNDLASKSNGHIIFIDDDTRHMFDVANTIRFINVKEFPIDTVDASLGFLCGIISSDYDIEGILIDGLFRVLNTDVANLGFVLPKIEKISEEFEIDIYITVSASSLPDEFKAYIHNA